MNTAIACLVAGDCSYTLRRSNVNQSNYYIKNELKNTIVWNGSFESFDEAITAAEVDGFEFD